MLFLFPDELGVGFRVGITRSIISHPPRQISRLPQQKWPPSHLSHSSWWKLRAVAEMPMSSIMQEKLKTQSNYVPLLPLKVIKQEILCATDTPTCGLGSCESVLTHNTHTHTRVFHSSLHPIPLLKGCFQIPVKTTISQEYMNKDPSPLSFIVVIHHGSYKVELQRR